MPFITLGQTTVPDMLEFIAMCCVQFKFLFEKSHYSSSNWPETDIRFRPVAGETSLCLPSPMKCQICYLAPIFAVTGLLCYISLLQTLLTPSDPTD